MPTSGQTRPLAAFEALGWLCANHADRTLKERAYAFSVALEWKDSDSGMLDTVTLQSWQEQGRTTDVNQAADLFVQAVEEVLLREVIGPLRSGTLRGLGALRIGRSSRAQKVGQLLEAADAAGDSKPLLRCYRDYVDRLEAGEAKWGCAVELAIAIRRSAEA